VVVPDFDSVVNSACSEFVAFVDLVANFVVARLKVFAAQVLRPGAQRSLDSDWFEIAGGGFVFSGGFAGLLLVWTDL